MAGNGAANYLRKLSQRAEKLGITDAVVWTGHLDGAVKWGAFAAAGLFVLPSYSENFGIAAAEALACRVPTIVTEGVGIADEIKSADGGLVVEPNATAIANALEQLLGNESRRHQLAENGRELARQHFSSQSVGHALESLYRKAIASPPLN